MERYFWLLGVLIATLLAALVGGVPFYGLVLFLSLPWVLFLTFGAAAMFGALGAAWMGNLIGPSGTQSRLLPIVGIAEATAGVMALVMILLVLWLESMATRTSPLLFPILLGVSAAAITLAATLATWRFRAPRLPLGREFLLTLGLMGLTGLFLVWGIAAAFFLSQVGV